VREFIDKISIKLGITRIELNTILFVVIIFLAGFVLKSAKIKLETVPFKEFNYDFQDSLFRALSNHKTAELEIGKKSEKRVDSDVELYDFSKTEIVSQKKNKSVAAHKSININSADIELLKSIPGIGIKTASNIISYRNKVGNFNNVDDLLEVKGIGKKKLANIKKYIYIEK
jgi:comEA protein